MKTTALAFAAIIAVALAACGGGSGSSPAPPANNGPPPVIATSTPTVIPSPSPTPTATSNPIATASPGASVSGDMLAIVASRAWNYTDFQYTITLYADPNQKNGTDPLVALAVAGDKSNALGGQQIGALGVSPEADGYHVVSFANANGVSGPIPGSPLLVQNTLTQGDVSTPYPGVTETVVRVGYADGSGACPDPFAVGAVVQYIYANNTYQISYVPGCGITSVTAPGGDEFLLQSIANYPQLGELSSARRVQTASYLGLAKALVQHWLHHGP